MLSMQAMMTKNLKLERQLNMALKALAVSGLPSGLTAELLGQEDALDTEVGIMLSNLPQLMYRVH